MITAKPGPLRRAVVAFGLVGSVVVPLAVLSGATPAPASTTFSNSTSISLDDPNNQTTGDNNAIASPYPSTISVTGESGAVSGITVTLSGVSYAYSEDIDALLVAPDGKSLILVAGVGPNTGSNAAASASDLTISDAGPQPTATSAWGSTPTFKPANFGDYDNTTGINAFNEIYPSPAPSAPWGDPGESGGGATLASQFDGIAADGTWSLYVITTSGGDGTGDIAGGWSLSLDTAAEISTTTSVIASPSPVFTSGANSLATFTATVDAADSSTVSSGTVNFTDGGSPITGCTGRPVTSGQAICSITLTAEGTHQIEATFVPAGTYGPSSGSVSEVAVDPTTVTGSSYCNTGSIALENPPSTDADADPYPSDIFVSGLGGSLSALTVTLKGTTYSQSQDIDALLVGPGGQSLILVGAAGPSSSGAISNVTLKFSDAALTALPQNSIWGAPASTVTTKPVDYGGINESFGAPAPAGPWGDPAPSGSATLGSVFAGTTPNGTWSLYLVTTGAGDGTGSVSGGWCLGVTAGVPTTTSTSASPSSLSIGPENTVSDQATVTGDVADGTPAGSVAFYLCSGTGQATCAPTGTPYDTEALSGTGDSATATSTADTPTAPGTYCFSAVYSPGAGSPYLSSSDNVSALVPAECFTVQAASTMTSTTAGPSSITIGPGNTVSDQATVTGNATAGTPAGSVAFYLCGPGSVSTCPATGSIFDTETASGTGDTATANSAAATPSTPGNYCFSAVYTPSVQNYSGSSDNVTALDSAECFTVTAATSTISTQQSASGTGTGSITYGTGNVSDTATVMGNSVGKAPTGSVTFYLCGPGGVSACAASGTPYDTETLVPGAGASDSVTSTAKAPTGGGTFCFSAVYNPASGAAYTGSSDNTIGGGDANECFTVIGGTPTPPTITNIPAAPTYGGGFAATVQTNGDGTKSVTTSTPSVCTVSGFNVSFVGVGPCTLTAHVTAGPNYLAADGSPQNLSVAKAAPAVAVTNSTPATYGHPLVFTAKVTGVTGGSAPTGTITWTVSGPGGAVTCSPASGLTTSGNVATETCTVPSPAIGNYGAQAQYSGDGKYLAESGSDTVAVTKATPSITLTNSTTVWSTFGNTVVFTVTLGGVSGASAPTGTVTWSESGTATFDRCSSPSTVSASGQNATATCVVVLLNPGTLSVTATYSGDTKYVSVSQSDNVSVARGQAPKPI